jgi:cell division protein FtsB
MFRGSLLPLVYYILLLILATSCWFLSKLSDVYKLLQQIESRKKKFEIYRNSQLKTNSSMSYILKIALYISITFFLELINEW